MFILRPSHLLQRRDDKYKFEYYDNDAIVNVVNVCERRWSSLTLSQRKYKSKRRILATSGHFSYEGCGDVWSPIRKSEKSKILDSNVFSITFAVRPNSWRRRRRGQNWDILPEQIRHHTHHLKKVLCKYTYTQFNTNAHTHIQIHKYMHIKVHKIHRDI